MAFSPEPPTLNLTIEDGKGRFSTMSVNLEQGRDLSFNDLDEAGRDLQVDVIPLIKGAIVGATVTVPLTLHVNALVSPDADSDVEEGALFVFETLGGSFQARVRIPTFDEAFLVPGSREVDLADADVVDFVTKITGGLDDAGLADKIDVVDSHGVDLTAAVKAQELFQKSRK